MSDSNSQTQFQKFRALLGEIVAVPKFEIDRREQEYRKKREEAREVGIRVSTLFLAWLLRQVYYCQL